MERYHITVEIRLVGEPTRSKRYLCVKHNIKVTNYCVHCMTISTCNNNDTNNELEEGLTGTTLHDGYCEMVATYLIEIGR